MNYNWLHITVNFFDSVCDIDFCDWSSSGSLFGRLQACFCTEVFGTTGQSEDIPVASCSQGRSDQTEQQTRRQCVTPTSLPFVVYGGSSVECLTRCEY